jgi:hypothetical protein
MARSHTGETSFWAPYCSTRRKTVTPVIAALALGALLSTPGWATPPDAQFSAGAGGASPILTPGSVSGIVIGDFPDAGGADAAYTTTTLTAHANGTANSRGGASSQATIVYYGEVVGPSATPIPLSIVELCPRPGAAGVARRLAAAAPMRAWLGESTRVSKCSALAREGRTRALRPRAAPLRLCT